MCFGGSQRQAAAPQAPAKAPAPPLAAPEEAEIGTKRKEEVEAEFDGANRPKMRVDRSITEGGVGSGGTGVKS